jgi:hypothetical protein
MVLLSCCLFCGTSYCVRDVERDLFVISDTLCLYRYRIAYW